MPKVGSSGRRSCLEVEFLKNSAVALSVYQLMCFLSSTSASYSGAVFSNFQGWMRAFCLWKSIGALVFLK